MTFITTTLTTIVVSCAAIIPGCQPQQTKPACALGIEVEVNFGEETTCDLDGSQQLNEVHNPMLTDESFATICFDDGGIPLIQPTRKICLDRDY